MQILRLFFLVFYIERHQTLFLGQIGLEKNDEKLSNFLPKPWINPFEKKANFATVLNSCFCGQERLAFHLKRHQTHF